jgi:hypothetical protein
MTHFEGQRWTAAASELVTAAVLKHRNDEKFLDRFWSKVDKRGECWIWTAALSDEGYGNFSVRGDGREHTVRAHRVSYMLFFGAVNETLFLDHVFPVCKGRWCVNPYHLEPVTNEENVRRGQRIGRALQRAARDEELRKRNGGN